MTRQRATRRARQGTPWRSILATVAIGAAVACGGGAAGPAALDPRHDACAWCRMAVSQPRFAAQLVAPREEPRFFDDIGCLTDYLRSSRALPPDTVVYVADHRSGAWVEAGHAVFVRCPALATPMASGLVAYADAASRDADATSRECSEVRLTFLPGLPPAGEP